MFPEDTDPAKGNCSEYLKSLKRRMEDAFATVLKN